MDAIATADANALIEQKQAGPIDRLATTNAANVLSYAPGLSADTKAVASSFVGDRTENAAKFLVSPAWGALSMASDLFTGGDTLKAKREIATRSNSARMASERSLAESAIQPQQNPIGLEAVVLATQETALAVKEQNKLVAEQNRLLQGNGTMDQNTDKTSAIRAQVAVARD